MARPPKLNRIKRSIVNLRLMEDHYRAMKESASIGGLELYEWLDLACRAFIESPNAQGREGYLHPAPTEAPARTVWIATSVFEACRKRADVDKVSLARVVHTALVRYLQAPAPRRKKK
jgi:hypothetical protein